MHVNRPAAMLITLAVFAHAATAATYRIADYGARADGETLSTEAIQKAIDTCHEKGGGTVVFPKGEYVSGTLVLKSNTTLHFEEGAVLLGSTDIEDYPVIRPAFRSFTDNYGVRSLVYAEKAHDIAITGKGTIDGRGKKHKRAAAGQMYNRPYVFRIIECENVTIRDLTLRNSAAWMQHYLACKNVDIRGITVFNHVQKNNDGLDIDCCENVYIADCDIDSHDDPVVMKSTSDRPTKNVLVENCVLATHCGAIDLGTESNGGFQNIVYRNITIKKATEGISLKLVDGGVFDGVTVSNVTMEKVDAPIFIRLGNRARPYLSKFTGNSGDVSFKVEDKDIKVPGMGSMKNIVISNIKGTRLKNWGCYITGLPGHYIENVRLSDINLEFHGEGKAEWRDREVPESETRYPSCRAFSGPAPAYGFFVRHVKNIELSNVALDYHKDEVRPALMFRDVHGVRLKEVDVKPPADGSAAMVFEDVTDVEK